MFSERTYQVILLPQMEVAEQSCTLGEANAWINAYNEVIQGQPSRAVIGQETRQLEAA